MVSKKSTKKNSQWEKQTCYWEKRWLFSIGNEAEIRHLEQGRKCPVFTVRAHANLSLMLDTGSLIFSSPEPKAQGELIVWDSSRRPSVRPSVHPFTLLNMIISETSWPIIIKFHQKHHWGGGLIALGFG